jgi:uncharacterized delta-60 repeat protein
LVLAAALLVGAGTRAGAAAGDLDTTFGGGDGKVRHDLAPVSAFVSGDQVVALVSDEFTGDWTVVRFTADGTGLDPTFGDDGVATPSDAMAGTGGDAFVPHAVHPGAGGSILVAGSLGEGEDPTLAFARFTGAGVADATFGTDGFFATGAAGELAGSDVEPDGTLVAVLFGSESGVAIWRFGPAGAPDATFSSDGELEPAGLGGFADCFPGAMAIRADGAVVVAANCTEELWTVARVTDAGLLDTTWGTSGLVVEPLPPVKDVGYPTAITFDVDGDTLVAGTIGVFDVDSADLRGDAVVGRYSSTGAPDAGFGVDGLARAAIGVTTEIPVDVIPDGAGGLLLPGSTGTGFFESSFGVLRLDEASGALDCGFGTDGHSTTSFTGFSEIGAAALDSGGRLVAAGSDVDFDDFTTGLPIVRYLEVEDAPDPCPDDVAAPTGVKMTAPVNRLAATNLLRPRWTATDPSGVDYFDVQRRVLPWNASGSSWTAWATQIPKFRASMTGTRGNTYCFRTRATDAIGNMSGYSAARCAAIPLRADELSYTGAWAKKFVPGAYGGFVMRTTTNGAHATRTNVKAERLWLVATSCPVCGRVRVTWNGTTISSFSLYSPTTVRNQRIPLATFASTQAGTLKVIVTSANGKTVSLEGLGVYRD